MRVGVIGTSNSILKDGYVDQLTNALGRLRVRNLSVGGSTIPLLPYMAQKEDLSLYNIILIDVMVNEFQHTVRTGHDLSFSLNILSGFLADVKASGAVPIFLVLPHRQAVERNLSAFNDAYIALAQAHGCAVINVYHDLYAKLADGAALDTLWIDDAHMAFDFHEPLAKRLLAFIETMRDQGWLPNDEHAWAAHAPCCEPVSFAEAATLPVLERNSSLMTLKYLGLPINTPVSFTSNSGGIYGLAYNAVKFCGDVEIIANGEQVTFELDDVQAETTTRAAAAPLRHRIVGFRPINAPQKQTLSGQIIFRPYETCPADVAEIECIFGARTKAERALSSEAA